jgi:hypothetical protein
MSSPRNWEGAKYLVHLVVGIGVVLMVVTTILLGTTGD